MRHLQQELADRRDRRLQLAERRQDFELENIRKRREMEEAAVWSTWKVNTFSSKLVFSLGELMQSSIV
jgi:hypothetical protein